jgi:hypothetical protein
MSSAESIKSKLKKAADSAGRFLVLIRVRIYQPMQDSKPGDS